MKKGFSILELLATIVIMSIIATISVPVLINAIEASQKKAFILNIYTYRDASELYLLNSKKQDKKNNESEITAENLKSYVSINPHDYRLFKIVKNNSDYYIILKDQHYETRNVTTKNNLIRYSLEPTLIDDAMDNNVIKSNN